MKTILFWLILCVAGLIGAYLVDGKEGLGIALIAEAFITLIFYPMEEVEIG
jgi:hypothetical protein